MQPTETHDMAIYTQSSSRSKHLFRTSQYDRYSYIKNSFREIYELNDTWPHSPFFSYLFSFFFFFILKNFFLFHLIREMVNIFQTCKPLTVFYCSVGGLNSGPISPYTRYVLSSSISCEHSILEYFAVILPKFIDSNPK